MPEWFSRAVETSSALAWETLVFRLIPALVLGLIITVIYNGTRNSTNSTGTFPATLVLLCVLIAMITQVIGGDIARAFSLVGALSIVRFRTVVRDTKDTAFVIFAVAVGMAVGANQAVVAVCGMVVIGLAAVVLRDRAVNLASVDRETVLTLKFAWSQALEKLAIDTVSKYATNIVPTSVATVRQGTAIEISFRIVLLPTAKLTEMVAELTQIEGIQSVELHTEYNAPT